MAFAGDLSGDSLDDLLVGTPYSHGSNTWSDTCYVALVASGTVEQEGGAEQDIVPAIAIAGAG